MSQNQEALFMLNQKLRVLEEMKQRLEQQAISLDKLVLENSIGHVAASRVAQMRSDLELLGEIGDRLKAVDLNGVYSDLVVCAHNLPLYITPSCSQGGHQ